MDARLGLLQGLGAGVVEAGLIAGLGGDVGDAPPHRARAEHGDRRNLWFHGSLFRRCFQDTGMLWTPVVLDGQIAQLVGDRQGVAHGGGGELLELGGGGVLLQVLQAEVIVVELLGLDRLVVEARRLLVADRAAEAHELGVAHLGDRLAGEGAGGDPLDRRAQAALILVERAVPLGEGVEVGEVLAQLGQALADHAVVLHLVAALQGEGHLGVHLGGGGEPEAGQLAGFELALQGEAEQGDHVHVPLGLRLQRLGLAQPREELLHLLDQPRDEFFACHLIVIIKALLRNRP